MSLWLSVPVFIFSFSCLIPYHLPTCCCLPCPPWLGVFLYSVAPALVSFFLVPTIYKFYCYLQFLYMHFSFLFRHPFLFHYLISCWLLFSLLLRCQIIFFRHFFNRFLHHFKILHHHICSLLFLFLLWFCLYFWSICCILFQLWL